MMKNLFLGMRNGFLDPPGPDPEKLGKRADIPEKPEKSEIFGRRHQARRLFHFITFLIICTLGLGLLVIARKPI